MARMWYLAGDKSSAAAQPTRFVAAPSPSRRRRSIGNEEAAAAGRHRLSGEGAPLQLGGGEEPPSPMTMSPCLLTTAVHLV
jgi:hypothetical protein